MSAPDAKAGFHVPSLDGIRGVAFLLVFAAHAGLEHVVPGGFGVTIFFFLSGYLITTLLRVEKAKSGTVSLPQFYLRRVLRILPPFYLILGAAAVAAWLGWLVGGVAIRPLAAQALHFANYWTVLHGYEGQPAGTGVYWSLAVEEHFYLVFPCVFLLLARATDDARKRGVFLWAMCAAILAWRCVLVFVLHAPELRTYLATDTRVDSILFGCALALWGNPMMDGPSRWPERTWKWLLVPLGLALLLVSFVVRAPWFRETFRYTLQGVALTPVFIAAIRFPTWAVFRPLNTSAAKLLGTLSYSLYLVHQVVLDLVGEVPSWPRTALAAAISFALAWGMYHAVEKPCARLRKRISSRGRPAPGPALAPLPLP